MKAARFYGPRDIRIEDVPVPDVKGDWVLIEMHSIGICGTDLSVYRGNLAVRTPVTLGHECAGVVVQTGSDVDRIKVGDRVFVEASWGCGSCAYCRKGLSLHCTHKSALGRTVDGAFAEYVAAPARVVYQIAENVPFDDAQSSSTIACSVRALTHARPVPGGTAAVVGSGHAGLILQQLLRVAGMGWIAMAGSREKRLALARELGADLVVDARSAGALEAVQAATDGLGVELSADAAATAASLDLSMQLATYGGTVVLFGIFEAPIDHFRAQDMYKKEIRLLGSKGGFGCYDATARLLAQRAIRISPLISHTFPLEGVAEGFRLMDEKSPDALRIVIHPKG
jgi:L-iditol 2-dehydrogenase